MSKCDLVEGDFVELFYFEGSYTQICPLRNDEGIIELIQVNSNMCWTEGEPPWRSVKIRFDRNELQAMIDMIDGKQVDESLFNR